MNVVIVIDCDKVSDLLTQLNTIHWEMGRYAYKDHGATDEAFHHSFHYRDHSPSGWHLVTVTSHKDLLRSRETYPIDPTAPVNLTQK